MEDVKAGVAQSAYTDRERHLARWFNVSPELIRELTDIAARIRQKNVSRSSSGLCNGRSETSQFSMERRSRGTLRQMIWWK